MGAPFQTQTSVGYQFSTQPSDVRTNVESEAVEIIDRITAFRQEADNLETEAKLLLDQAAEFSVGDASDVSFSAAVNQPTIISADMVQYPSGVYKYNGSGGSDIGPPPRIELQEFTASTLVGPTDAVAPTFDSPPSAPPLQGAVSGPSYTTVWTPPDLRENLIGSLPDLLDVGTSPPLPEFFEGSNLQDFLWDMSTSFVNVEPFKLEDLPVIDDSVLDRLEWIVSQAFERNPYVEKILPRALEALNALLSGSMIVDLGEISAGVSSNLDIATDRHKRLVSTMWTRRGFSTHGYAEGYAQRVKSRVEAEHNADFAAAAERWRMELVPAILQLTTEAHSIAVEMLGELYDFDFEMLAARQVGLLNTHQLAIAKFNIGVAKMEMAAAEYRGPVEQTISRADRYKDVAGLARVVGPINRTLAEGYVAETNAEGVKADSHSTEVDVAKSQLRVYDSKLQSRELKARTLRADLLRFQAKIAEWAAKKDDVEAEYRAIRSKNRAVVAQNRAQAAEMSVASLPAEVGVEVTKAQASETVALAAKLRAELGGRIAQYVRADVSNAKQLLSYQGSIADYQANVATANAQHLDANQLNRAVVQLNNSVAATYEDVGRNAIRAAELTQASRAVIAQAYAGLYDQLGRADAARIAGELSRFRASFALRAAGDIDYSSQVSRSTSFSSSVDNSGSNAAKTQWVAAEEGS